MGNHLGEPRGLYLYPWGALGVLHLALHEIFLGRAANLVSINSASSRFSWFATLPCRHHISHVQTSELQIMQIRCPDYVPRSYLQLWYSWLSLEMKIRSPKQPRKIISPISDLSTQQVFRGPYLLAPWPELAFLYVQIEAIIKAHKFGIQTFAIRGR
jgi:hypothetical protein